MAGLNIRKDFPVLEDDKLVYLDSGATSLKPKVVIDAIDAYYRKYSANVHRGIYKLSEKATLEYENARSTLANFLGASDKKEIIFTRGTTESINLLAYALGEDLVSEGDEIVTTIVEHHSNFVPWQELAMRKKASFKVVQPDEDGEYDFQSSITEKTKILALTYVSNVMGLKFNVKEITSKAKEINPNIIIVVDAAQAAPHTVIDVQDLGCDFLALSGHKMCGPTGIGVLWGREELLNDMKPFQYGGDMIQEVSLDKSTYAALPNKFEAGTPDIAGAIGLGAAAQYLSSIGLDDIHDHTNRLAAKCMESLDREFGSDIAILNKQYRDETTLVSFVLDGVHPHDIAQLLDEDNIAVRAGHHCAMPLHTYLGQSSSVRASFYLYNTEQDVDAFISALKRAKSLM